MVCPQGRSAIPDYQIGGHQHECARRRPMRWNRELITGLGEWQIAELVENNEVQPGQVIGEPSLAAIADLGS